MAFGTADRCYQLSTSTGSGALTFSPSTAVSKHQTFLAGWGASGTGWALILNDDANEWVVALCTLNAAGTTITPTVVKDGSSGVGVAVSFGNGTKHIIGVIPAFAAKALERLAWAAAAITPPTNDGTALGTGALSFSDLFLAVGGVINWGNGDVTATHSANALAFAGASGGYTFDVPIGAASGGVDTSAWTAYSPTITPGSGSFTSVTASEARYKTVGKTTHVRLKLTLTTIGTAGGSTNVTLPNNVTSEGIGSGVNVTTAGLLVVRTRQAAVNSLTFFGPGGAFGWTSGEIVEIFVTYEND